MRSARTTLLAIAAATALLLCRAAPADAADAAAGAPPLVVATHPIPPFVIHKPDGSWGGISIDLWKQVAGDLGLAYEIRSVPVADLLDPGKGFDAVVSLNVTARAEKAWDLTHAFYSTGLAIATRPEPDTGVSTILRKVFSLRFLRNLLILVAVIVGVGVLVWRIERDANPNEFGGTTLRGIRGGVFWAFEAIVGKATALSKTRAARLFALFWTLACVVLISSITARMSSEFTVSQLTTVVSGPQDLPKVSVGAVRLSLGERYLDTRAIEHSSYDDVGGALTALASGKVDAVVFEAPILQYNVAKDHPGKLIVLPGTFLNHGYAFALRPGSPHRERINLAILDRIEREEWRMVLARYLGARG